MDCKHHAGTAAVRQCRHCGAFLCESCYDAERGGCHAGSGCTAVPYAPKEGYIPGKNMWIKTLVSILAIIGAITVLLLALCAGIIFTSNFS